MKFEGYVYRLILISFLELKFELLMVLSFIDFEGSRGGWLFSLYFRKSLRITLFWYIS